MNTGNLLTSTLKMMKELGVKMTKSEQQQYDKCFGKKGVAQ
jgi:hypothetical protein